MFIVYEGVRTCIDHYISWQNEFGWGEFAIQPTTKSQCEEHAKNMQP